VRRPVPPRDKRGYRGRHGLVDEFDLLWVDLVGAQRLVEEDMGGGAGGSGDAPRVIDNWNVGKIRAI
jgi:hypothetical protein